jgi:hypothetical protein
MSALITTYYREHDDFRQYTAASKKRMTDLSRVYKKTGRHFGKNVLDLAWGRSRVCSRTWRLRIYERDSNPDMIMAARDNTRKNRSSNRFIRRLVRPEVTFHLQLDVWSLKGEFTKTSPNPQL